MLKNKLLALLILSLFFLAGCSVSLSGSGGGKDGGFFKTSNKGDVWTQKVSVPALGQAQAINNVNVMAMEMDPSDRKAIYLGTFEDGLFYTYDQGETWRFMSGLGKISIGAIAVDPIEKCVIFTTSLNKVFKTTDCGRTWSQIYYDSDLKITIDALAIDHYNNFNIYIGNSRGDIILSSDRGGSWRAISRFSDKIAKIVLSPSDSRMIFVGTRQKGLFRSNDAAASWIDLKDSLKQFGDSSSFKDLILSKNEPGVIVLVSALGLIKSTDYGDSWTKIELLTPDKNTVINAATINLKNSKEVYYTTNTSFLRSLDGGQTWATKKLPTTRACWKLIVDPEEENIIYMGVRAIKK
jgi:photosystem II stability/assembly factor-like uncharacterized protein